MRKLLLLLLLLSVTNSFSQDVYKTLLEGTYWGQPFELRQVTKTINRNSIANNK